MALGNIRLSQIYWNYCSLLIIVRVLAKAITDQRRLQNVFLANFVGILLRFLITTLHIQLNVALYEANWEICFFLHKSMRVH